MRGTSPEALAAVCTGESETPRYGVLSRSYNEENVLVLVRPKDRWDCTAYGDDTAVVVDLPTATEWRLLLEDGSLTEPVSSIALRNAEAVILFNANSIY